MDRPPMGKRPPRVCTQASAGSSIMQDSAQNLKPGLDRLIERGHRGTKREESGQSGGREGGERTKGTEKVMISGVTCRITIVLSRGSSEFSAADTAETAEGWVAMVRA